MLQLLGQSSTQKVPRSREAKTEIKPVSQKRRSDSTDSCISNSSEEMTHSINNKVMQTRVPSMHSDINCDKKRTHDDANEAMQTAENRPVSDSGSASSIVEDGAGEPITVDSDQNSGCKTASFEDKYQKIDVKGIRERIKRRKLDRVENKKPGNDLEDEINGDGWIERELEKGIELIPALS